MRNRPPPERPLSGLRVGLNRLFERLLDGVEGDMAHLRVAESWARTMVSLSVIGMNFFGP
jgi:hypothetical protein